MRGGAPPGRAEQPAPSGMAQQSDQAMAEIDTETLRAQVEADGRPLVFATVSGAHLQGFASADSDVDVRGCFVAPLREAIGIKPLRETIERSRVHGSLAIDWVAHDVRTFALLISRKNGCVLEQVFSPLVVCGGPRLDELREIARGCLTRHHCHHYRGFARNQRKRLEKPGASLKDLLYAYRVLFTGIHLLDSGEVQANLEILNDRFGLAGIPELLARKREGKEAGTLEATEVELHEPALDRLEQLLEASFEKSSLPDAPTSLEALDGFVVRARLELGQEGVDSPGQR